MKKQITRKILLGSTLSVLSIATFASCSSDKGVSGEEALKLLIIDKAGSAIQEDFTVPTKVSGLDINWTSSNESVIKLYGKDDENIYAEISRPNEDSSVVLTADVKGAKKTFEFTVPAVTVNEIADSFKLEQSGKSVFEDFDLPTQYSYELKHGVSSTVYDTKTATLAWTSSKPESISIDDKGHATVVPSAEKVAVELSCVFSYNGRSSKYKYTVNTYKEVSAAEKLMNFYANTASTESQTIRGWVVAKEAFSTQYKNTSLYIMDESRTGGLYGYRVVCTQEEYDKIELGTPVALTGTPGEYNGCVQMAQGGTITFPDDLEKIDVTKEYKSIDKAVIVGDSYWKGPSNIQYSESSLVSLTGWKVTEINSKASASATSTTQTVLKVAKNGVTVSVAINKNLIALDSEAGTTVIGYINTFKVGDVVDIKGILGYYNGYQIIANGADTVVKSAGSETTVSVANITAAENALSAIPATVSETTSIQLPASTDSVKYAYTLNSKVATLDGTTLAITPVETLNNTVLTVEVEADGLKYTKDIVIVCQVLDANGKVDAELAGFTNDNEFHSVVSTQLATQGATYTDVVLSYALNTGAKAATITSDGYLYIVPVENDETVTLTVTATVGSVVKTKDIQIKVKGYKGQVKTVAEASALDDGQWIYVSGTITKYYEYKGAVSGIYIKDSSGETEYQVFKLYDHKNAYAADAYPAIGSTVILYGKTASYNGTKQLASSKVVLLTEPEGKGDAEEVQTELDNLGIETNVNGVVSKSLSPTGTTYNEVALTYTLSSGAKAATITSDGYLYIVPTENDETVTLTVTAKKGQATKTVELTITIKGYTGQIKTVAEVNALEDGNWVYVSGTITKYYEYKGAVSGIFIKDSSGETEYQVYKLYDHKNAYAADAYPAIGSNVILYGKTATYTDKTTGTSTKQLASSKVVLLQEAELTDDQKADKVLTVEAKKFDAKYPANATVTLAEGVTAAVKEGTTATTVVVNGSTVSITPAEAKEDVVLVLTYTLNDHTYTKEVSFVTQLPPSNVTVASVAYNAPASDTDIAWGSDVTSYFAFPEGVVASVVINQGTSNQGKTIFSTYSARVYQGANLVITAAEGYTFTALEITFDNGKTGAKIEISSDGKTITITAESQYRIKSMSLSYSAE